MNTPEANKKIEKMYDDLEKKVEGKTKVLKDVETKYKVLD